MMIDEQTQNLALRYVLAELDEREQASFRQAMDSNDDLLMFVTELRETASRMALSTPPMQPPPHLLEGIFTQISKTEEQKTSRPSDH